MHFNVPAKALVLLATLEERRQKKKNPGKSLKAQKQGQSKPGTDAKSSVSYSSNGAGSGSRNQDGPPTTESTAGAGGSRKTAPPIMMTADCAPVSPGIGGMPPLEVNVENDMSDSTRFRPATDEMSVLSCSVAFAPLTPFTPHSTGSGGAAEDLWSPYNLNQVVDTLPSGMDNDRMTDVTLVGRDGAKVRANKFVPACRSPLQQEKLYHVVDALISGMDNDRMTDVTLVGRDGIKVRATKFVLACRSPAMQEKLYQDPTQVEVFIGDYGEDAIRAMKEYCHTGAIKGSVLMTKKNGEAARGLVELATLAKVYGFDPLYGEADSILYKLINSSPWFATACYDSAGSKTKLMEESLLQFIKSRCPDLLLETNGLKHMSQQRLTVLLDGIECSDGEMLKYLEKWIELKGATRKNVTFLRATAASKLNLVRLLEDPEMAAHVRSSGIFDRYTVESIINASPIMEEEEEEGGSYDEDGKYVKDDEDDDQLEICPANGSSSMLSLQEPTSATLQIITQMVMESAGNASVSSKEKKKKKKEKKDRDKDKEKKDRDKDKEKKDSDSDKDKDKDKKDKKRKHKRKSSKSRKSSADLLHELERIQEEIEPEQIQEGIEPLLK